MSKSKVSIDIKEIKNRELYRDLCRNKKPIFFPGDPIEARIIFDYLEDNQPLKYKSIHASIIGKLYKDKVLTIEFPVANFFLKQKKADSTSGVIEKVGTKLDFTFNDIKFPAPSYHGFKINILYFIQFSIVLRSWKQDIVVEHCINVLMPEPTPSVQPVFQFIEYADVSFNVYFDKDIYACNDIINGQIAFADTKESDIANIYMNLVVSETYNSKTEEKLLLDYQVMDGCPKSGTTIPFCIQLLPYKLFYIKDRKNVPLTTRFFIDIKVNCNTHSSLVKRQEFNLFLPQLC